jgi:hypothetical protein
MSACTKCGRTTAYLTSGPEPVCLACATNAQRPPKNGAKK